MYSTKDKKWRWRWRIKSKKKKKKWDEAGRGSSSGGGGGRRRRRNYLFVRPSFRYKRAFMFAPCYARCFIKWNKFCSLALPPSFSLCLYLCLIVFSFSVVFLRFRVVWSSNGAHAHLMQTVNIGSVSLRASPSEHIHVCVCVFVARKCIRCSVRHKDRIEARWFHFCEVEEEEEKKSRFTISLRLFVLILREMTDRMHCRAETVKCTFSMDTATFSRLLWRWR